MLGKLYEARKQEHGGNRKSNPQNAELKTTSDVLAEEYKVNHATVERAADFAKAKNTAPGAE